MAFDLLSSKRWSRVNKLDCDAQIEEASHGSEPATLSGIEPIFGFEVMRSSASPDTRCWRGNETILLVEDQVFVRQATAEVLESAGYRVLLAGSAAQAGTVYRQCLEGVDLLLLDVVLPGTSGRELAAEFAVLCPQIRILLMSGYIEQLTPELGHYRKQYLAKPFSTPILLCRVREALDGSPPDFGAVA
jgi:two-component system cell cycle sensor histidine kinase/response regulator CckA